MIGVEPGLPGRCAVKRLAVALLVVSCSVLPAQDTLSAAVKSLTKTGMFAFGGVGFIGKISQGEIDFRTIQSQPPAVALASFETVFASGDEAAQLYALAGIRQLDKSRFKELFRTLDHSDQTIFIAEGCIIERRRMADIAKAIDDGSYDSLMKPRP